MLKRVARIELECARREKFFRMEIKNHLLKSLIQDHNNPLISKIIYHQKVRTKARFFGVSRHRGACLLTGRAKGVVRFLGFSRQSVKRQGLFNNLQNIRVGS